MPSLKQKNNLKTLVKSAISELVSENEGLIQKMIEEAIEDAFMTKSIKVGRKTKKVSRNKIFNLLDRQTA